MGILLGKHILICTDGGVDEHRREVPTTQGGSEALWVLGMVVDILLSNVSPVSSFVSHKLSQNKIGLPTEHRAKEWKSQEQNKTEGHREWEREEDEDPRRGERAQAADRVPQSTRWASSHKTSGEMST